MAFGKFEKGICNSCSKETWIFHKSKNLCKYCNQKQKLEKKKDKIREDNLWYKEAFENSNKICEECNKKLKTFSRANVSHILSKGAFPKYRYHKDNYNILCFDCHQIWEFGDKKNMRIWNKNEKIINNLVLNYYV
mgnify:CR=1 FL=1